MRFKDKIVLITGASRGIGRATAIMFAKEGAKVVVNYIKAEKEANDVLNEIKKTSDGIIIKCDVSREDEVKGMIDKIIKKFGKIDVLVNNAGVVFDVPFEKRTISQWKRTLEVDLIGVFLCSKYTALKMSNGSKIVNISSTNALNTFNPESIDYGAAKAGVINLTNNLALQFAPKIRVNCIAPGWIDTDMNKDLPKEYVEEERKKIYLKRFAKPEEIASAVLFLASDESSFITGSTLIIDGGYK